MGTVCNAGRGSWWLVRVYMNESVCVYMHVHVREMGSVYAGVFIRLNRQRGTGSGGFSSSITGHPQSPSAPARLWHNTILTTKWMQHFMREMWYNPACSYHLTES